MTLEELRASTLYVPPARTGTRKPRRFANPLTPFGWVLVAIAMVAITCLTIGIK
ncbi:MAG TPA: hypothetical protein VHW02_07705 [Rhizomicrobium sp.]|jgi:hypothetical protein|nr:hypothetical protein [Rhizomicrobium sp.]